MHERERETHTHTYTEHWWGIFLDPAQEQQTLGETTMAERSCRCSRIPGAEKEVPARIKREEFTNIKETADETATTI